MGKEKKYTISNISEKQLRLISKALDLYTRIGLLQFDSIIIDDLKFSKSFSYLEVSDDIEKNLKMIRNLLVSTNPNYERLKYDFGSWSLGITGPDTPKSSRITYEMYGEIDNIFRDNYRPVLKLTEEETIKVEETNERIEKMMKIIEKLDKLTKEKK